MSFESGNTCSGLHWKQYKVFHGTLDPTTLLMLYSSDGGKQDIEKNDVNHTRRVP